VAGGRAVLLGANENSLRTVGELLMWWNMDPINPDGSIAPFQSARHGFPLIAGGILKPITSLAYVDDAKRYVALPKASCSLKEFFDVVQGYCDLLVDSSLVIKMGRNVRKCTIYLYNIPENCNIPVFTSIAWSYDSQGPVKGTIDAVVVRRDCTNGHLICYQVPKNIKDIAPQHIKNILAPRKYLGVPTNAQLDASWGKERIVQKLNQRIAIVASKAENIQEAKITHNMLVCQIATYSPICISMTLKECASVDRQIIQEYHYRLNFMASNAKHSIFISEKRGGIGIRSFTKEYIAALLRDVEIYTSNEDTLPAHALITSLEEATKQKLWNLKQQSRIPSNSEAFIKIDQFHMSGKKTLMFHETFNNPTEEIILFDHKHSMELAVRNLSALGFLLKDLKYEFPARLTDEVLAKDKWAKAIGNTDISSRASMNAIIGEGNIHFEKYSAIGHVYLFILIIIEEALKDTNGLCRDRINAALEENLGRPSIYRQIAIFSGEISPIKLATAARDAIRKFKNDYKLVGFYNIIEWRRSKRDAESNILITPRPDQYKTLIGQNNFFQPMITNSTHKNSMNLVEYLNGILKLKPEDEHNDIPIEDIDDVKLLDSEILELASQHDLPIFISIDGGYDQNGAATTSMCILAPDIRDTDAINGTEWQNRPAKILLI